jgi:flavin-dependent dehydrogenase
MIGCDVAIIGAGPAGLSTGIALAAEGVSVCVLHDAAAHQGVAGETISPRTRVEISAVLNDASALANATSPCYGFEAVWGNSMPAYRSHVLDPFGYGWHVDRTALHTLMLGAASDRGVRLLTGHFEECTRTSRGWCIVGRHANRPLAVDARFAVDATGYTATLARHCGARRVRFDRLCAVSAVLNWGRQNGTLLLESTPYGWWSVAPLPQHRSIVCLFSDADIVRRLRAATPNGWLNLLRDAPTVREGLPSFLSPTRVGVNPCNSSILDRMGDRSWLAVGDAASVVDPLSSMGVAKALNSGREAALAIQQSLLGDSTGLTSYVGRRFEEFRAYLQQRSRHYALEYRWPREPFWARRHGSRRVLNLALTTGS